MRYQSLKPNRKIIAAMAVVAALFGLVLTAPSVYASAGWTAGKFNKTYDFNGQFYIDAGNVYNGVKSVAFWTKGTSYNGKMVDLNGSAYISISAAGVVSTTGFTSPTIYIDGVVGTTVDANWHYVAITTATAINASAVKFGSVEASNLVGMLDDVKMFNYALSAREINEKYRQGSPSMARGGNINDSSAYAALTVTQSGAGKIVDLVGDSITTGAGLALSVDGLTTGTGLDISSTSTAGGASGVSKLLNLSRSGANANLAHTAYGLYSTVTNTNATSGTNIAGYFSASGATTANYGLIVENGSVGIGTAAPGSKLDISQSSASTGLTVTQSGTGNIIEFKSGANARFTIKSNGEIVLNPSATQTLLAADAILANATHTKVAGSGGAVILTSTPTIADGSEGQVLIIRGTDDTNNVTVQDQGTLAGSNLEIGAVSRTLGNRDVLVLMFDGTDWVEVSFSNN